MPIAFFLRSAEDDDAAGELVLIVEKILYEQTFFVLCRSRRTRQMYIYKATWAIYVQSIHKMMMMILIEDMQSPSFPASNLLIFHSFFISYHSILPSSSLFIISGRQAHPPHQHVHALPFFCSQVGVHSFFPASSLPHTLILSSSSRFPFHSHYMLAYTFFFSSRRHPLERNLCDFLFCCSSLYVSWEGFVHHHQRRVHNKMRYIMGEVNVLAWCVCYALDDYCCVWLWMKEILENII